MMGSGTFSMAAGCIGGNGTGEEPAVYDGEWPYEDELILDVLADEPHGGGEAYAESMGKLHPSEADVAVASLEGLEDAIDSSAEIIAIESDIEMGEAELDIGSKTIVGDRGWEGSDGPLLSTDQRGYTTNGIGGRPHSMFYSKSTSGEPRVTGLRLRGARWDEEFTRWDYDDNLSRGVTFTGNGGEVDNCEIFGFTWNGVHIRGNSASNRFTHAAVHHCHLHKSYQIGYGYGVDVWRGVGDIHHNYFNEHRHSIDGFGFPESGYVAEENIFGPDQYSHTVDMHCLTENNASNIEDPDHPDFGLRAGGEMTIQHNTFCYENNLRGSVEQGPSIRGVPLEYVHIYENRFVHPRKPPYNSGNDRNYAWTQQNVHAIWRDIRLADDGEYTEEWDHADNQFNAPAVDHDGRGASVDLTVSVE